MIPDELWFNTKEISEHIPALIESMEMDLNIRIFIEWSDWNMGYDRMK